VALGDLRTGFLRATDRAVFWLPRFGMATNPKLEEAFTLIREAFAEEYTRGRHDATERANARVDAMIADLRKEQERIKLDLSDLVETAAKAKTASLEGTRTRAARGAPEAFVRRVLSGLFGNMGITPKEIQELAETAEERAISYSSIRAVLARGAEAGWSRNTGRKWYWDDAGLGELEEEEEAKN
jgi:hypothetical protein